MFTDESTFYNAIYKRNYRLTEDMDRDQFRMRKTRLFKVNVYGFITRNGFRMFRLEGNLNKDKFYDLINRNSILEYADSMVSGQLHFLQDNTRVHEFPEAVNLSIRDYVENSGKVFVEFPRYSPDLNIIENVWAILKKKLSYSLTSQPVNNEAELWARLVFLQDEFNESDFSKYFRNYPNRLRKCIELEGKLTKY